MIEQLLNILVFVSLIEMMLAVGLGVTLAELLGVARNGRLVAGALLVNYLWVPALTVALVWLFRAESTIATGLLVLAVCPGAPFGPPCTAAARGNTAVSVGVMVILAVSSAIIAPLLLSALLPLLPAASTANSEAAPPSIDTLQIVRTLLLTQLLPLTAGLAVRHRWPMLASRLHRPASALGTVLGLLAIALIIVVQFATLTEIHVRGYVGMLLLFIGTVAGAWLLGGRGDANRRAMALTTALRNVGVALVIVTSAFAGSAAATAVIAFGIFGILGSLLIALAWGRVAVAPGAHRDAEQTREVWREKTRQLS